MSDTLPLKIVRRARDEIREAIAWWETNRHKAPHALRDDLRRALRLLRDSERLPACPRGSWQLFKTPQENGKPRVGFSEEEAKRGIARDGYYLFRLQLVMREHAHR